MNSIVAMLMTNRDQFEPLFEYREFEGETFTIVDEWCDGYVRGVALTEEHWQSAGLEMQVLLAPIRAFTQATDWAGHQHKGKELQNLRQAIVPNVREIHAFWQKKRDETSTSHQPMQRESKVGRNDLCPCGSGKKYKKCCLH